MYEFYNLKIYFLYFLLYIFYNVIKHYFLSLYRVTYLYTIHLNASCRGVSVSRIRNL